MRSKSHPGVKPVKTPLKTILAVGLFVALGVAAAQQAGVSHFDGNAWWSHVKYLADDSLEGRGHRQ